MRFLPVVGEGPVSRVETLGQESRAHRADCYAAAAGDDTLSE